jgi:cation diffusion facilitator family transporter
MAHGSKKAVVTAIAANSVVTVIKFFAATASGSASMMNEAVHSLMDTLNQAFLFRGLVEAERPADDVYAFGHVQKKYLWNLWSAIGLFSIGAGLGLAHAWHSWHAIGDQAPAENTRLLGITVDPLTLMLIVLAIAFVLEGYSWLVAVREFIGRMRADKQRNPFRYLLQSNDPTLVAIVLEDSVAMLGLAFAAMGIGLSAVTGNPVWDVLFSGLIAVMLGLIAFYLGVVNMRFLADMRDPKSEALFKQLVARHREVARFHDLRSIVLDENHTVLVAEIELREEAVLRGLRRRIDQEEATLISQLPTDRLDDPAVRGYAADRAAVQATLARAEEIVDELEAELKRLAPRVVHVTLEVEGITGDTGMGDLPA